MKTLRVSLYNINLVLYLMDMHVHYFDTEMMRQAGGVGGKASSPKDPNLIRQRERQRVGLPGK